MINLAVTWNVDPTLFSIGSFEIRYYSLSWMIGFMACIWMMNKMLKKEGLTSQLTDTMFMYTFIATVVGARVGHCLFYDFDHYIQHPFEILYIWEGGLASHGAALGLLVGIWLFARKTPFTYIWALDRITTVIPVGGAFIRLGNLMNSEIYGTPTELPWGFIFVRRNETLAMHPTQIYEALIYLLIFGLLVYLFFKKDMATQRPGALFGIFLITLFGSRFFVEMIKNVQESFEEALTLNMGQILSIPFVVLGVIILVLAYRKDSIFKQFRKKR